MLVIAAPRVSVWALVPEAEPRVMVCVTDMVVAAETAEQVGALKTTTVYEPDVVAV
jgi:hypothetical protein